MVSAPGKPQLTVVGYGGSPGRFGDGWVLPGELAALHLPAALTRAQMLYTFTRASNIREITADVAALRAALPAGTVVSYQSWLDAMGQDIRRVLVQHPVRARPSRCWCCCWPS